MNYTRIVITTNSDDRPVFFPVFVYTLVGDYGYETLKLVTDHRGQYFPFTQILIAYWILVSAVLLLNIFIALMSGD